MPYITSFRYVDLESNRNISLLEMDNIPGRTDFAVEFSIVLDSVKDYQGYVSLRKLDQTLILDTNPFEISKEELIGDVTEGDLKEEKSSLIAGFTLRVVFEDVFLEKPGIYLGVLIVNEEELGTFAITIVKRKG